MDTDVIRCGSCHTEKRTFGTGVHLCPECDFARCSNKGCGRTVKSLNWAICPHCGKHQ